ncbi:MAG: thymidine phosphorylase [Acidimicrobiia bacterium]|nr:thymidine phosphorylase [Acidimicrobiia bacterium]MDH5236182.1 thymidine phosphorylase [Acidimicrobiia bacterium]
MTAVELIERKRDGGALTEDEIRWFIAAYVAGEVPDYQMAAMAMAVFFKGLDGPELAVWTDAMLHSGDVLDLSGIAIPKVDKHSTGGVGDKASIPVAAMVAACGVAVPMMSGRGLGHTGGTLDKLEAIPGFTTALQPDQFVSFLGRTGLVLAGQSETLVPADRHLYALRDATGTVPSIPLIASSIMSKKLAEDLDGLVLDVKVGSGAFMTNLEDARALARTMVDIGATEGTPVVALLTGMDQPLGNEVGNASEMVESVAVLRGEGPDDLTELSLALGAEMLVLAGVADRADAARRRLQTAVTSGAALDLLARVVEQQGGDPAVIHDPTRLPVAPSHHIVEAPVSGTVTHCDARRIGVAAMRLGAGREKKEDDVDPAVGITVVAKVGDPVAAGDPMAVLHYRDEGRLARARAMAEPAWSIGDPVEVPPLVIERMGPLSP